MVKNYIYITGLSIKKIAVAKCIIIFATRIMIAKI